MLITNKNDKLNEGAALGFFIALTQLYAGFPAKILLSIPAAFYAYFVPDNPAPVMALGIIFGIDYVTGFLAAVKRKEVSSRAMVQGAGKLVAYLFVLVAAYEAAKASRYLSVLPEVVCGYLALTEFTSVLENLNKLGYDNNMTKMIYRVLKNNSLLKTRETTRIKTKKKK